MIGIVRAGARLGVASLLLALLVVTGSGQSPAEAVPTTRLLVTGDSITQGSSGDYTWRYRLWKKLESTAPGGVAFVGPSTALYDTVNNSFDSPHYAASFPGRAHGARWGTTFLAQLDQIASQVVAAQATTLVVALGFNDLSYFTSPQQTIDNAREYIRRARAARPGLDVVITEVTDAWDPWTDTDRLVPQARAYADLLPALRAELNTSSERVEIASTLQGWNPRVHTWDGVHPNPTGETVIAQRVSEALARLGVGSDGPSIIAPTSWDVAGPTPAVTVSPEDARLTWSRVSTGSTGMFIHYRLQQVGGPWERLPYAVGSADAWNMAPLVAGGTYDFALSPSKGFSSGVRGPSVQRSIPAEPFAQRVSSVGVAKAQGGILGRWGAADNAQSYQLAYRTMSDDPETYYLPYPVSDVYQWHIYPLSGGRYYRFLVRPTRGFVSGEWELSGRVRTDGVASGRAYIALGDSYSSGLGSHDDVEDYTLGQACRRTSASWPFRMQDSWQVATKLVACQGDTLDTGIDGGVRAQLDQIKPFFAQYPKAPQLITVTVGGNDVGFSAKAKKCVTSNCLPYEGEWLQQIENMVGPLRAFYASLRDIAPNADIIVGGYPHVFDPEGNKINPICTPVTGDEKRMVARLVDRLNSVIYNASEGSAHTQPIWSAGTQVRDRFRSHGACQYGDEEWIHSYTTGGGLEDGVGKNTLHPKHGGQLAYAFGFSDALMQEAG